MTDLERLKETFTAIGVPFEEELFPPDHPYAGDTSILVREMGGYQGFFADFSFDKEGGFVLDKSGVWE